MISNMGKAFTLLFTRKSNVNTEYGKLVLELIYLFNRIGNVFKT